MDNKPGDSPFSPIVALRIIWFALLAGPLLFTGIVYFLLNKGEEWNGTPQGSLVIAQILMFTMVVPITFVIFRSIYKRSEQKNGFIDDKAYATGRIIFWAGCEGVAFFGLTVVLVNHTFIPTIYTTVAALLMQVATYPTGYKK